MRVKKSGVTVFFGAGLLMASVAVPATSHAEIEFSGLVEVGMPPPKEVVDYTETHPLGEYVIVHYLNDIYEPTVICCDDQASLDALGVWCESSWGATYWGDWPDFGCGGDWSGWDWSSGAP